jgi:hypothetical protein
MPTMAPPEDATAERFARLDERFDEVNRRITEGREESKQGFERVEGDMRELRRSSASIQATLIRVSFGLALTFASVAGAILTKSL